MSSVRHFLEYSFVKYRATWVSTLISSTLTPAFFLFAIGFGLGSQIDDTASLGTDDYASFIGPGVIAATAMIQAVGLSLWPTLGAIKWEGTYNAILATPMTPRELATGHLLWIGFRTLVSAVLYVLVLGVFGIIESPAALLAPLTGAITGVAFAAPLSAFSAAQENDNWFSPVMRLGITPLFLLSGAFFPVAQLPEVLEWLARATPVFHGVAVTRGLINGSVELLTALGHTAYLLLWCVGGWVLACRSFGSRLAA